MNWNSRLVKFKVPSRLKWSCPEYHFIYNKNAVVLRVFKYKGLICLYWAFSWFSSKFAQWRSSSLDLHLTLRLKAFSDFRSDLSKGTSRSRTYWAFCPFKDLNKVCYCGNTCSFTASLMAFWICSFISCVILLLISPYNSHNLSLFKLLSELISLVLRPFSAKLIITFSLEFEILYELRSIRDPKFGISGLLAESPNAQSSPSQWTLPNISFITSMSEIIYASLGLLSSFFLFSSSWHQIYTVGGVYNGVLYNDERL